MNFELKYKKYKQKYLNLKKQYGSGQDLNEAYRLLVTILDLYPDKPILIGHLKKLIKVLQIAIEINKGKIPEKDKKTILVGKLNSVGITLHNDSTSTVNFETSIDNIAVAIFKLNEFINENESNLTSFGIRFNEISFVCADAVIDEIYTIILNSNSSMNYGKPIITNIINKIKELITLKYNKNDYFDLILPIFKSIFIYIPSIKNYMKAILNDPRMMNKASFEIPEIIPLLENKSTPYYKLADKIFDYILLLEIFEIVNIKGENFINLLDDPIDESKLLSQTLYISDINDYKKFLLIYIKFFNVHTIKYKDGESTIENITGSKILLQPYRTILVCSDKEIDFSLVRNIKFNN
jgi:hypothetical protein